MYDKEISAIKKHLKVKGGHVLTTSLDVARIFKKKHKNVIQAIENPNIPAEFSGLNFQPGSYPDAQGQMRPMYEITRDGFTLLGMGFTGSEAMRFKIAYIEAFNEMEKALLARSSQPEIDILNKRDIPTIIPTLYGPAYINFSTVSLCLQALVDYDCPAHRQAREALKGNPLWGDIEYFKLKGLSNKIIAKICDCHPSTIRKNIKKMKACGFLTSQIGLESLKKVASHVLALTGMEA